MRITFITLKLDIVLGGGANRGLDIKLRALQQLGHDVRLITIFPELNKLPKEGVPYPIEEARPSDKRFQSLQQHVVNVLRANEERTDIYNIDGTTFLWAGGMYRKNGGRIPVVAYLPTYMEALNLLTYELPEFTKHPVACIKLWAEIRSVWLKNWIWAKIVGLRYANALDLIFVPAPVVKDIYGNFGFPKERIAVLPEFIDPSNVRSQDVTIEPIPINFSDQRPFRLLHVGRLLRMKGVDLIIEAIATARKNGRAITATIVGDGPQKERLEQQATNLGINEAIEFVPWREEHSLASVYAACDAFVHPCRFPEPLGRTIIEAMFFQKPIITTEGSGSAWAADKAGVTSRMEDVNDLERVISDLYDHPERLREMATHTQERVAFFEYHRWTSIYVTHLEEVLATSR